MNLPPVNKFKNDIILNCDTWNAFWNALTLREREYSDAKTKQILEKPCSSTLQFPFWKSTMAKAIGSPLARPDGSRGESKVEEEEEVNPRRDTATEGESPKGVAKARLDGSSHVHINRTW